MVRSFRRWFGKDPDALKNREPINLSLRHWKYCIKYPKRRKSIFNFLEKGDCNYKVLNNKKINQIQKEV